MAANQGTIVLIRGSVVDVLFSNLLPEPRSLLKAGKDRQIALEVMTYLGSQLVRTITLFPTQGLARGSTVIDIGNPLQVPVGEANLSRMFNVFGKTIDGRKPLSKDKLRSLHAHFIPLCDRATTTDIFLTGIKAIDVLAPLEKEKGGKAGLFDGAGVGKTVLITELVLLQKMKSSLYYD